MQEPNEIKQIKQESSIEITKNTKGYSFSCKAYGSDNKELRETLNDCLQIAKAKIKELEAAEECEKVE